MKHDSAMFSRLLQRLFRRKPVSFPPFPPPQPTGVTILERRSEFELLGDGGSSLTLVHVIDPRNGPWEALRQRFVLLSLQTPFPARKQGSATRLLAFAQNFADVRGMAIELTAQPADRRTDPEWLTTFYCNRGFSGTGRYDAKGRKILRYEPKRPVVLDLLGEFSHEFHESTRMGNGSDWLFGFVFFMSFVAMLVCPKKWLAGQDKAG